MQETTRPGAGMKFPASPVSFMPFLDLAVIGVETQLKAWQAYQVEGARFVANRMQANLECLGALGHCTDAPTLTLVRRPPSVLPTWPPSANSSARRRGFPRRLTSLPVIHRFRPSCRRPPRSLPL